jgi:hypothetical protein
MSNIRSLDTWQLNLMRWVARILSIPWAIWALFITWFALSQPNDEGKFLPIAVLTTILIIAALMYIGAAIIASVWGKEALGGRVLLVDGALILVWIITFFFATRENMNNPAHIQLAVGAFLTMILPPLVAGYLFLICHRRSKMSQD